MVVSQMLMAAFNPSDTSGTKIDALLFSDNARNRTPSHVFDVGTCFDHVQGQNRSLSSLITDFGVCIDHRKDGEVYNSMQFPSSCGEGTSAVKGLQEIHDLAASRTNRNTTVHVLMLTDGIIKDDKEERERVLKRLKSMGITLIAAGYRDSREIKNTELPLYTSEDNILFGTDVVQLSIDIVNKMEKRGILSQERGNLSCSI